MGKLDQYTEKCSSTLKVAEPAPLWDISNRPSTRTKLNILKKYFGGVWLKIWNKAQWVENEWYVIDLFAGKGNYTDTSGNITRGSPLIFLEEIARNNNLRKGLKIKLFLIESNKANHKSLLKNVNIFLSANEHVKNTVKVEFFNDDCNKVIDTIKIERLSNDPGSVCSAAHQGRVISRHQVICRVVGSPPAYKAAGRSNGSKQRPLLQRLMPQPPGGQSASYEERTSPASRPGRSAREKHRPALPTNLWSTLDCCRCCLAPLYPTNHWDICGTQRTNTIRPGIPDNLAAKKPFPPFV